MAYWAVVTPHAEPILREQKGTMFFNPSSGVKRPAGELSALQNAATSAGLEVIRLTRDTDVPGLVREQMKRGRTLFVAAGGDGTINSVIQALVNSDAVLGVVPVGTFNHFARDLGVPLDCQQALQVVLSGATRQVDAARVNDRFFVNNISLGLYPELVARREERGRDYARWRALGHAVIWTLRSYPHISVTAESEHHQEVIRTHVLMISNNSYDLSRIGIQAPRSTLDEGRLSIYWLPHLPRLALMRFVARYLAGRVKETPGFRSFRTARVKLQSSRPKYQLGIDGEVFTMNTPLIVTIVPQSLLVRVPREG